MDNRTERDGCDATGSYSASLATRDGFSSSGVIGPMARIWIRGPSRHWPDLRPHVYVEVCGCEWRGKVTWRVDMQCEQGDERRTQWNAVSAYDSRDEAADEATAFVLAAVPLLVRSCDTGEVHPTPGMRREAAARLALEKDEDHGRLAAELASADAALVAAGDGPAWHYALPVARHAKDALEHHDRAFVQRWHREHDWREYD